MRWKCTRASPWDGALHLACLACRLLPSVANVPRRGRHRNDCAVFDGCGFLDAQSNLRSVFGVLCSGCLTKKVPDQPSNTPKHQSRCHSLFVAGVIQCVLLPWCIALTSTWSRGSHHAPCSEPRSRTISEVFAHQFGYFFLERALSAFVVV